MIYAPILIPTLNRYEHLRKCLESLSRCTWAEQTDVYVSLDYPPSDQWDRYAPGWEKNREFLRSCGNLGFKNLFVIEQTENLGIYCKGEKPSNLQMLINIISSKSDKYIVTEDDNVFSPAFLDFMNKSLEKYQNDDRVMSICGFSHKPFCTQKKNVSAYITPDVCGWGYGTWLSKRQLFNKKIENICYFECILHSPSKAKKIMNLYPALYEMLNSMVGSKSKWGDVMETTYNIIEGCYQIRPAISLVQNIGFDGSGVHCGEADDEQYVQETLSNAMTFDMSGETGIFETKKNYQALYNQCLYTNKEKRLRQLTEITAMYKKNISFRVRLRIFVQKHIAWLYRIWLLFR